MQNEEHVVYPQAQCEEGNNLRCGRIEVDAHDGGQAETGNRCIGDHNDADDGKEATRLLMNYANEPLLTINTYPTTMTPHWNSLNCASMSWMEVDASGWIVRVFYKTEKDFLKIFYKLFEKLLNPFTHPLIERMGIDAICELPLPCGNDMTRFIDALQHRLVCLIGGLRMALNLIQE